MSADNLDLFSVQRPVWDTERGYGETRKPDSPRFSLTCSSSSRAHALAAAVEHQSIFREASSASSLSDERRKNISNMPEIGETRKEWQGLISGPLQ